MSRIRGVIILFALLPGISGMPGYAATQERVTEKNKANIGEWAENPEIKLRVSEVKEIAEWSSFPFNKRFIPARLKEFEGLEKVLDAGRQSSSWSRWKQRTPPLMRCT
jgi:hypothetical protein